MKISRVNFLNSMDLELNPLEKFLLLDQMDSLDYEPENTQDNMYLKHLIETMEEQDFHRENPWLTQSVNSALSKLRYRYTTYLQRIFVS